MNLQKEVAKRLAAKISDHLERRTDQIELFAHFLDFEKQTERELVYRLNDLLAHWHEYDVITVADREGQEICKVSRYYTFSPDELSRLPPDEVLEAVLRGQTHISRINLSPESQLPRVRVTSPVRDFRGVVQGIIALDVNVSMMWRLLSKYRIGTHREAYVVDADGSLIIHESISSVLKRKNLKNIEGVKALLAGSIGAFEYDGLSGGRVVGANAPVSLTGWGVLVEEPVRSAYRELYMLSAIFLALFVCTIASAFLFGLRFSNKRIIEPVKALKEEAASVARGDFTRRVDMGRPDELGQLGESFNRMVDRLQEITVSRDELAREIEDRRAVEESLRRSEEKYRDVFENTSDLLCIHDLQGNLIETNLAFKEKYGYGEQELCGLNLGSLIPERYKHQFDDYLQRIKENGKDSGLLRVMTKEGQEILLEYSNSLVFDATGPVAVRGSARDVTEAWLAQERLKESEAKSRALLKTITETAILLDRQGNVLAVNQVGAVRLGYKESEILG